MTPTPPVATRGKPECPAKLSPQGWALRPPRRTAAGIAAAGKSSESTTTPVERVEPVEVAPAEVPPSRLLASLVSPPRRRVISYEEASEIVENAQNLPDNENDNK